MSKKSKPTFDITLNQDDWYVYATKAYSETNSRTEGVMRTVKIVLLDKHYDFATDDHEPYIQLDTYIVNQYGNNKKHWRKILKLLDDDCVVELNSAIGEIGITERDQTLAKNKDKLPLIDADTPFQVVDIYPTDNYGNNVILKKLDAIRNYTNQMQLA